MGFLKLLLVCGFFLWVATAFIGATPQEKALREEEKKQQRAAQEAFDKTPAGIAKKQAEKEKSARRSAGGNLAVAVIKEAQRDAHNQASFNVASVLWVDDGKTGGTVCISGHAQNGFGATREWFSVAWYQPNGKEVVRTRGDANAWNKRCKSGESLHEVMATWKL